MRHQLTSVLLGIAIVLGTAGCRKSDYDSDFNTLQHDGEERQYLLHVPTSYSSSTDSVSLVIALHGGTGSAKNIEGQSGLPDLSDEEGFILCSPNGIKRTWNAGGCCGKAMESDVDDVGFISELIDVLLLDYRIDPDRVYVCGMSNGGFMAYRLACEIPEKIAAIAPVAATMNFELCDPASPVSIIHFHSLLDVNVPQVGGVGHGISDHYNPPLDSVLGAWAIWNGCLTYSESVSSSNDFTQRTWQACQDSTEMEAYMTFDGGHSWPGGAAPRRKADQPSKAVDANERMWAFFQSHPKRI